MRLPYLHHTGFGLYMGQDRIILVELVRFFDSVRVVNVSRQELGEGDIDEALAILTTQTKPVLPVSYHLDPLQVRYQLVKPPEFDEPGELEDWSHRQAAKLLPPGIPGDLFTERHAARPIGDEASVVQIGIAKKDTIERRASRIMAAGLTPSSAISMPDALGAAFILDPHFAEGFAAIVWMDGPDSRLFGYQKSMLQAQHALPYPTQIEPQALLAEIDSLLIDVVDPAQQQNFPIFLSGPDAFQMTGTATSGSSRYRITPGGLGDITENLIPEDFVAVGLAMYGIFPGLPVLDFQDHTVEDHARTASEKHDSIRLASILGRILLGALILLGSINLLLGYAHERANASLQAVASEHAAVQETISEVEHLRKLIQGTTHELDRGGRVTPILDDIGRSVPESLWLSRLAIGPGNGSRFELTIEGLTTNELSVADFLMELRRKPTFGQVDLIHTTRLTDREASTFPVAASLPLVRFEINISAEPAPAGKP